MPSWKINKLVKIQNNKYGVEATFTIANKDILTSSFVVRINENKISIIKVNTDIIDKDIKEIFIIAIRDYLEEQDV